MMWSANLVAAWISLAAVVVWCVPAAGLQCPGCGSKLDCPSVSDCPGGTVPDVCGCCLQCARVVNETCGGRYRSDGKCDEGLVCVIAPPPGAVITGEEVGICRVIPPPAATKSVVSPPGVDQLNCNAVECGDQDNVDDSDVPRSPACPTDSLPAPLRHHDPGRPGDAAATGQCCEPRRRRLACQCLPCDRPADTVCAPDQVRVLVREGRDTPGRCCDVYQCLDHAVFCNDVDCSSVHTQTDDVTSPCPPDSFRPEPLVTQDGCCVVQQRCRCKGEESCGDVQCPTGLKKRVVRRATGLPGSCCNTYDCVNGSSVSCADNATSYDDGDSWTTDDCLSCVCRDGLSFCQPLSCPQLTSCGWVGNVHGRCCPVCKVCRDGNSHDQTRH